MFGRLVGTETHLEIFLVGADLPQGDAAAADLARDVVAVGDQIAQPVAEPRATHAAVPAKTAYRALEAGVRATRREPDVAHIAPLEQAAAYAIALFGAYVDCDDALCVSERQRQDELKTNRESS